MSTKTKKLNQKIQGFNRNPATGQVSIIDNTGATRPISFIGYNDIYGNATNKFGDIKVTPLTSYSNPAWTEYKLLGYGNHSDSRYPNPVRANARRIYLNSVSATVNLSKAPAIKDNGNYLAKDRKQFLLYIDPVWDLNITFDDVTKANFTVTWPAAMTSANGSANTLKLNYFRPKFILEGANGLAFQKAGRAMLIEVSNNTFPELLSNSTAGITLTVTSSGSGMKVGGVAQTTYTIPANKLKVANWAAQTYELTNTGSTLAVTNKNQGAFWNLSSVADYEYIEYLGGYPLDNTTEKLVAGIIYARVGSNQVKLPITDAPAFDYYSNSGGLFSDATYNPITDLHCVMPAQNVASDPETMVNSFYSASVFGTYAKGNYSYFGYDAYYDYDYEKNFSVGDAVAGATVTYLSDSQLLNQVKKAQKYGVWSFVNAFWNFQNYNYSIYGGTAAEQKVKKNQAQQNYIDQIMSKVDLLIQEVGYCMLILGNESNLDQNLKGELNGNYIFFADQANQNKQANVNAMMDFFNRIARDLHNVYGNKVIVGPSVQFANQGQVDEILTAINAGLASNFDLLFNNYYGYSNPANPTVNVNDFDAMAYYKANRGANKLNVVLSECGIGSRGIDVNNVPAGYDKKNGTKGFIPTTPVTYTSFETNQAAVGRNLIVKLLKTPAYSDVCQGLFYFGDFDQTYRSSLESGYGVSTYDSFIVPATNFVSNADTRAQIAAFNANPNAVIPAGKLFVFEEKASGQLWKTTPKDFDPLGNDYQAAANMPTLATQAANELPVMAAVRAEIALGVQNLIYANEI